MTVPKTLAGQIDNSVGSLDGFGSAVDYLLEHIPQLRHPYSVLTYAQMAHYPQLAAILRVYLLALQRGSWTVDGTGCDDTVTALIADDLGLPVKGADSKPTGARRRRFTWAKHLPIAASLSLKYGHAGFAQAWTRSGGLWHLDMVQERMPQTLDAFELNNDGTLKWVEQGAGLDSVKITTADHRLVWYDRGREGSNYWGESLLRPSYGPWLIADQMLRVLGTSHRRNGMGVWQVQAPQGAEPNQIAEAQRIASTTTASQGAGIGLPPGFTAELKGMTGTLPDTAGFVQMLDRYMTRSTLTSLLDMATAERGNRSLGETVMALMVFAQQAEGQRIADDATQQLVVPLVDANFGEGEPAPRISVTGIGEDQQLTAQDLNALLQYGGLTPDDVLEADTRRRYGLPDIDQATRRFEITAPAAEPDADDATTDPEGGADG